jgi:hypothetical protein
MKDSIKQEMWRSIKIVVVGLFISCVLLDSLIMPLTHQFIPKIVLYSPIFLFLWAHFSIFIAGVYVGLSKEGNKLLLAAIMGLLFYPVRSLIFMAISSSHVHFNFNLLTYILNTLRYGLFCVIFVWLSNMIFLKFQKNNNSGANY